VTGALILEGLANLISVVPNCYYNVLTVGLVYFRFTLLRYWIAG